MNKLVMMIGLPRSGKSSWVKNYRTNEVVISADEFRLLIYGQRYYQGGEEFMWACRNICLKLLMQQGADIIIDETNTTRKSRSSILKLVSGYEYTATGIYISTPPDICADRARETNQRDLISVIDKLHREFELPEAAEGFDRLITI